MPGLDRTVLLFEPASTQRITYLAVRVGHPEVDTLRAERPVQIGEQLGTGEIHVGNRAEKKDDQAHSIGPRPQDLEQSFAPIKSDSADVTVMTVCFELQKSQNTSPEKRHA